MTVTINAINAEKLELFLTKFLDLIVNRQAEYPDVKLYCDILKSTLNTHSSCGTPGCHAGWLYLVMSSFDESFNAWLKESNWDYDYNDVGDWFLSWLFDVEYNKDDYIVHSRLKNSISEHLWGNPLSTNMFSMQEAFDANDPKFDVTRIIHKWEDVLRKLKYKDTMHKLLIESGYIPEDKPISNDDMIYAHWKRAKEIWEMMDAANPMPVALTFGRLLDLYRRNNLAALKHPLVLITLDKLNQLLGINGYGNSDLTKAYDIANKMYQLVSISPYGPVQPVL